MRSLDERGSFNAHQGTNAAFSDRHSQEWRVRELNHRGQCESAFSDGYTDRRGKRRGLILYGHRKMMIVQYPVAVVKLSCGHHDIQMASGPRHERLPRV